jgi:DNA-binding response OmpR family regulator
MAGKSEGKMTAPEPNDAALTVLLIEDEETIIEFLTMGLTYEGFAVHAVRDGRAAMPTFERVHPHLVLLDIMLPGVDGITLCRSLRARSDVPIIMLTARGEVEDRIAGLDSGADDYLPKPFRFAELMARIRAVLRRHQIVVGSLLTVGDLRLDRNTREVTDAGTPVTLTPREFDLLECFMLHPRQVLTRDAILNRVWGYDQAVDTNVVDVYVRYLRAKLNDDRHERIEAVRGVGYTLR